ncbi:glucosamine-6-phosphate deaminase [Hypericibacter adhaerens]|uniref:Glucosamine-6-phosphate deaminase n=1 Tax=Hypericibacter adhaerens TaxID=2602016 RepID=A0A5J6N666_9PROT|nr:glucosamine-6-phosphate deaminase [Hypericibacter adhaerens]QEX24405.1 glucosamine-6-phosphate deaminase [Hypericibacter adhaerens]
MPLPLNWLEGPGEIANAAAQHVATLIARKPDAAIALPTGSTPVGLYRRLAELQGKGRFSCPQARFFNLDEFIGLSLDDPRSYGAFLWQHVFRPLSVSPSQVQLLRGAAPDPAAECRRFDQAIAQAGGLDLAILGLGSNGHIAFNEPGSDWNAGTREVVLTEATRHGQRSVFGREADVPHRALTMGLRTLREARAILLLIAGSGKAAAVAAMLRSRPDKNWPVTAILDHPKLTILADRALDPARAAGAPPAFPGSPGA